MRASADPHGPIRNRAGPNPFILRKSFSVNRDGHGNGDNALRLEDNVVGVSGCYDEE